MMKTLSPILAICAAIALSAPLHAAAADDSKATCEKSADEKKLAGAARNSHVKKCMADSGAAAKGNPECERSADEKKLAGAARSSHVKKCAADMAAKKK